MADDRDYRPIWDGKDDLQENIKNVAWNLKDFGETVAKWNFYLFGAALAMVISYFHNHSIPWGIGHGILS